MEREVPGNTGNNVANQFYKEPCSLDDLVDGGRGGKHRMSVETRAEFEDFRDKRVDANVKAPVERKKL